MSNETLYTDWDTAYLVKIDDQEIGRVWHEEDTEWNAHHLDSDMGWDFIDTFEDAVECLKREEEQRS